MRTWRGSPSASPAATSTPDCARRAASSPPLERGVRGPHEVGLAVGDVEAALAQRRRSARGRSSQIVRTWRVDQLRAACAAPPARRPARPPRRRGRARARPAAPPSRGRRSRSRRAGRPGPRPWRSCGRRAGAGGRSSSFSDESTGWASANSTSDSSSSTATPSGRPSSSRSSSAVGEQLAGRVVGAGERDHARRRAPARPRCSASMPPVDRHGAAVRAARHDRVERVGGPGGEQLLAGLDQRARGGAEQLGGAVAEDQPRRARRRGARRARRAARCRAGAGSGAGRGARRR